MMAWGIAFSGFSTSPAGERPQFEPGVSPEDQDQGMGGVIETEGEQGV